MTEQTLLTSGTRTPAKYQRIYCDRRRITRHNYSPESERRIYTEIILITSLVEPSAEDDERGPSSQL